MKRLLGFLVIVAIAWYGWKNYGSLRGTPTNEVVIVNETNRTLGRLRVSIAGVDYPAYDSLYRGKDVVQKFPITTPDGTFELHWTLQGTVVEPSWQGGKVSAGPVRMRHRLQIQPDYGVIWSSAPIPEKGK